MRQLHLGERAKRLEARNYPESEGVDAAGICSEGRASYPGRPVSLPCATGVERRRDGLAGVSRRRSSCRSPRWRRAEPVTSGQSRVLSVHSEQKLRRPPRAASGTCRDRKSRIAGAVLDGCQATRCTKHKLTGAPALEEEPPYTEPYVRWCGRTAGVTLPPTRIRLRLCSMASEVLGLREIRQGPGTQDRLEAQRRALDLYQAVGSLGRSPRCDTRWLCDSEMPRFQGFSGRASGPLKWTNDVVQSVCKGLNLALFGQGLVHTLLLTLT